MSARDAILNRIRVACERGEQEASNERFAYSELLTNFPETVRQRLQHPQRLTQPDVPKPMVEEFIAQMEAVQISVVRLQTTADVVEAVDWYKQTNDIKGDMCVAPALESLEWPSSTRFGAAQGSDEISVTRAIAGIAETGSLALASSYDTPSTLNFLPESHVVVLHESQIVSHLEDVWSQLRGLETLPRAFNLITGPSRTGDIEQTIELGAHGPRRMHVLLVAAER